MAQWMVRLLIAVWFCAGVGLSVRGMAVTGQTGENHVRQLPLLFRNAPVADEPGLSSYVGLFTSDMDGDSDLYTVRADGSDLHQLTENTVSDGLVAWSPDGTQIAFVQDDTRVMVMNLDGSNQRLLYEVETERVVELLWLRSGEAVLVREVVVESPYQGRIVHVTVASGERRIVADNLLGWVGLSHDGQQLLFRRVSEFPSEELWMVPLTGGDEVQLCDGCQFVAWHPFNGRILYRQEEETGGEQGILTTTDGSSAWIVYESPYRFSHWLEGGRGVLLTHADNGDVYTAGIMGGTPELLIQSDRAVYVYAVSPRDSSVLYVEPFGSGASEQLFVQPLDGSTPIAIPESLCMARLCFSVGATWSDDGTHILHITEEHYYRVISTRLQGIDLEPLVPTVTDLVSGPIGRDGFHLPYSSRYIHATSYDPYGNPGATDIQPLMIDASVPTVQPLPFPYDATTLLVEWRHLP